VPPIVRENSRAPRISAPRLMLVGAILIALKMGCYLEEVSGGQENGFSANLGCSVLSSHIHESSRSSKMQ
jgi:hypothetical protein